jgi:hypothetical protein
LRFRAPRRCPRRLASRNRQAVARSTAIADKTQDRRMPVIVARVFAEAETWVEHDALARRAAFPAATLTYAPQAYRLAHRADWALRCPQSARPTDSRGQTPPLPRSVPGLCRIPLLSLFCYHRPPCVAGLPFSC